jgi:hypothetical protein
LQAAMEWSLESGGDPETGCRIAGALFHFWYIATGYHQDARRWTLVAKKVMTDDVPSPTQAWVLLDEEWFLSDVNTAVTRCWRIHELFVNARDAIRAAMVKTIIGRAVFYAERDYP